MKNIVITIGRQYGSGGHEIGKKLAEVLEIPFYDKELVDMASQRSNINKEVLEQVDERATNSFLYSLVTGDSMRGIHSPMYYDMPMNDKLFIAQSDVIKNVALTGSCVIVGRCADYVLKDTQVKTANIFIYADMKSRIDRISKIEELSPEKAKDKIVKTEKRRKAYYNYYSSMEWGKIENYDLSINSSVLSLDDIVQVIKTFVEKLDK